MVGFVQRPLHPVLAGGTVMTLAAKASAPALRFSRTRPYAHDLMPGAVGADKLHRNRSPFRRVWPQTKPFSVRRPRPLLPL